MTDAADPSDAFVQVAADGVGKKIDNSTLTREPPDPALSSTVGDQVHRQRVALASARDEKSKLDLTGEVGREAVPVEADVFKQILNVLIDIRKLLQIALD